jgi:hypothetical protein
VGSAGAATAVRLHLLRVSAEEEGGLNEVMEEEQPVPRAKVLLAVRRRHAPRRRVESTRGRPSSAVPAAGVLPRDLAASSLRACAQDAPLSLHAAPMRGRIMSRCQLLQRPGRWSSESKKQPAGRRHRRTGRRHIGLRMASTSSGGVTPAFSPPSRCCLDAARRTEEKEVRLLMLPGARCCWTTRLARNKACAASAAEKAALLGC